MVAGEASGDLLAGLLLRAESALARSCSRRGIGGPQMAGARLRAWWPHDKLAVRGYVEVLRHCARSSASAAAAARLLRDRPDVFIGVDAPDFNLGLEQRLREAASRPCTSSARRSGPGAPKRVEKLKRAATTCCASSLRAGTAGRARHGATYVGHPLADVIPMEPDQAAAAPRWACR
jgi:lipid-A-disaccharide synthase